MDIEKLDDFTDAIYLEVPATEIVLLQALFEGYEGLGVVRTIDVKRRLVCVMTTPSMLADCMAALGAVKQHIDWRPISPADKTFLKQLPE